MKLTSGVLVLQYEKINHTDGKWFGTATGAHSLSPEGWNQLEGTWATEGKRADRRGFKIVLKAAIPPKEVTTLGEAQEYMNADWVMFDGDRIAREADDQLRLELDIARRIITGQNDRIAELEREQSHAVGELTRENIRLQQVIVAHEQRLEELDERVERDGKIIGDQSRKLENIHDHIDSVYRIYHS